MLLVVVEYAVPPREHGNIQEEQGDEMTKNRRTARERRVLGRTKRRNETRTQHRGADTTELLLERHVGDIADGEPAGNQFDGPGAPRLARTDEGDQIIRESIGLHLDLGQIPIAIILHEQLQLFQLGYDHGPCSIAFRLPRGGGLARIARPGSLTLVRLPSQVARFQPTLPQQAVPILAPSVALPPKPPPSHDPGTPRRDVIQPLN